MANYSAVIVSTALAESKEKHTPSVRVQFRTDKCLDTDEPTERLFIADLWLSDKAVERTVKTLRDLGFEGQSMSELNFPEAMQGVLCEISTEMQEYNGETQERVKFVNRPGHFANRGLRAASDDLAQSIAQRYDAALRTGKYHKPAQKAPAYGRATVGQAAQQKAPRAQQGGSWQQASGAEGEEDDLPF